MRLVSSIPFIHPIFHRDSSVAVASVGFTEQRKHCKWNVTQINVIAVVINKSPRHIDSITADKSPEPKIRYTNCVHQFSNVCRMVVFSDCTVKKQVVWRTFPLCISNLHRYRICLTHLTLDKMVAFSQTIFSETFSWMKHFVFLVKTSLKFVPKGPIDNNPALV